MEHAYYYTVQRTLCWFPRSYPILSFRVSATWSPTIGTMAEANKEAIFTQDDAESGHISKHGDDEVAIHTETFAIKREALGEHLPPHYWRSPAL